MTGMSKVLALLVLVVLTGCTSQVSPPPQRTSTPQTQPPSLAVPATADTWCGDFGEASEDPRTDDWYTVHLGVVAMPTKYEVPSGGPTDVNQYEAPDGTTYYFMKSGLPVWDRTVVTITSADGKALMDWYRNEETPTTSQTLGPCGDPGTWHVYGAGGIYVPAEGCYDFLVEARGKRTTVTIGVGAGC